MYFIWQVNKFICYHFQLLIIHCGLRITGWLSVCSCEKSWSVFEIMYQSATIVEREGLYHSGHRMERVWEYICVLCAEGVLQSMASSMKLFRL